MRFSTLFALLLTLCSQAFADIDGTYQGGFDTPELKYEVELRCNSPSVCELQTEAVVQGAPLRSLPLERFPLKPLGGCTEEPFDEWSSCIQAHWQAVKKAIDFSRSRKSFVEPEVAELLSPFLDSKSTIKKCFGVPADRVVCELTESPWNRPAILYLEPQFRPCDGNAFFCTYKFLPLFKTSDKAEIRARRDAFLPPEYSGPPSRQQAVAAYVRELEYKIGSLARVPTGAPANAFLDYRIQFNQHTGRITHIGFVAGCYCPEFRKEVYSAVMKAEPLPVLPKEQWQFLGGQTGTVYLRTSTAR